MWRSGSPTRSGLRRQKCAAPGPWGARRGVVVSVDLEELDLEVVDLGGVALEDVEQVFLGQHAEHILDVLLGVARD